MAFTLTRLILWKPYMLSWRTKLENYASRVRCGTAFEEKRDATHVIVLKVTAQYTSTELPDIRDDEGCPEIRP
jgi:hypothetical protein